MSTFHGLEMAKQALFAQQSALYTTGHNISNANTEGYTRQRVNFEAMSPYPTASRNRPEIPGQMGTGVQAGSVERIRDKFLDIQFRAENSKTGYWNTMSNALGRMEHLMNETTDNGLSKSMDLFWQSLHDLAVNPDNAGARSVVVQRGVAVAETFNHLSNSLNTIRTDLQNQIEVTVKDANSLLNQINAINNQIKQIEPHGYLANDLYDERDRLIDELSGIINIKVTHESSSDSSPKIADGVVTIELANDQGASLEPRVLLVNGKPNSGETGVQEFVVNVDDPSEISIGGMRFPVSSSKGSLSALVNAYGTEYKNMIDNLDAMAEAFATAFNEAHAQGIDLEGNVGIPFFEGNAAGTIKVVQGMVDNPDLVAASKDGTSGNGDNALALAAVFDEKLVIGSSGKTASVKSFYESLIGDLGVRAGESNRMARNTGILSSQVEFQRMSVSSVSLDEEMSNMIKFQHAYNAAARNMTAIDEMLDRIINGMGLVGR